LIDDEPGNPARYVTAATPGRTLATAATALAPGDTAVLAVLMFTGPVEERRFIDVEENAVYWYFVVLAWLPIYGVIYWAPRLI